MPIKQRLTDNIVNNYKLHTVCGKKLLYNLPKIKSVNAWQKI